MKYAIIFLMTGLLFLSCKHNKIEIAKNEIADNHRKLYLTMISTNDSENGKETFLECHNEEIVIGFKLKKYIKEPQLIDPSKYDIEFFNLKYDPKTDNKKMIIRISFNPSLDVDFPYMISLRKEFKILNFYEGFDNKESLVFTSPKTNKLSKPLLLGHFVIMKSSEGGRDSTFNVSRISAEYNPLAKDNTLIYDKEGWILVEYK